MYMHDKIIFTESHADQYNIDSKDQEEDKVVKQLGSLMKGGIPQTTVCPSGERKKERKPINH